MFKIEAPVVDRETARQQKRRFYNTGTPCPRGHTAARLVSNGECTECRALLQLKERKHRPAWAAPREAGLPPTLKGEDIPRPTPTPASELVLGPYRLRPLNGSWLLRSVLDPEVKAEFKAISQALDRVSSLLVIAQDPPAGDYGAELKRVKAELVEQSCAQMPAVALGSPGARL